MPRKPTGLAEENHVIPAQMRIDKLMREVCSRNITMCRNCPSIKACEFGKRFVKEYDAGNIQEFYLADPVTRAGIPQKDRERIVEERLTAIMGRLAKGEKLKNLYMEFGYNNYDAIRRAVANWKKKKGIVQVNAKDGDENGDHVGEQEHQTERPETSDGGGEEAAQC
jgi:hypothetical protein